MYEIVAKNPNEIKVLGITDLHLSYTNLGNWIYNISYSDLSFKILNYIYNVSYKLNVDLILVAGDLFHSSSVSKNPINFINKVVNKFQNFIDNDIPIFGIAGNHDQKYGSNESIYDTPIGNLILSKSYLLLDNNPVEIKGNNFTLYIDGKSFYHAKADWVNNYRKKYNGFNILVGHFLFGSRTGKMFNEDVFGPDYLGEGDFDLLFMGHRHENQGTHFLDKKWFVAPGALTRTGLYMHDRTRTPSFVLISCTKEGINPKQVGLNKLPSIDSLFDLKELEKSKKSIKDLEEFIKNLKETDIEDNDILSMLQSKGLENEILERCKKYLI